MHYQRLELVTDGGLASRARIGMLVLRTDQTLEYEAARIMAHVPGVVLHHARIFNDFEISRETLMAMKPRLPETAALLPVEWGFKSIGYGCTSGAMVIGEAEVARLVRTVHRDAAVTNPLSGALAGLAALGRRRVGVLTPYVRSVNDGVAAALRERDLDVTAFASYEEPDDNLAGRIPLSAIAAAAVGLAGRSDVDAVFVSCTSLRTVEAIGEIERIGGKPVTSSNHAMVWHMLRLAGIDEPIGGFGQLFERGIAAGG